MCSVLNWNVKSSCFQTIGYGVTISAPHMHASALELLVDHLKEGWWQAPYFIGGTSVDWLISVIRI